MANKRVSSAKKQLDKKIKKKLLDRKKVFPPGKNLKETVGQKNIQKDGFATKPFVIAGIN